MKILAILRLLKKRFVPSLDSLKTRKELLRYPNIQSAQGPLVLCQAVEDYTLAHRLIHFMLAYQQTKNQKLNIGWILLRRRLAAKSFKDKFRYAVLNNPITDFIWISLYKAIGGHTVIRLEKNTSDETHAFTWAQSTQKALQNKEDLIDVKIEKVLIGDLIYDTYLRFKPAPTVDIEDPFLEELLIWSWDLYHQLKLYLDENKVTTLVTSYTSYIHHGILVRMSLERNIPVYAIGAQNQLVVKPTKEFPFHMRNFHQYREHLKNTDMNVARNAGSVLIQARMEGKIDPATAFMQTSSYRNEKKDSTIFGTKIRPRAVVMGHDFYDSPHIYGTMLFADFYEWIEFVFTEAVTSSYDFFYKPHPNGLPENHEINESLKKRFPHIRFLDKTVSNRHIIEEGFDVAFSVYGTIAHEFAYKGIPVVNAGANPHQVYGFNICAHSKAELRDYIKGTKMPVLDASEVPEFCYIHNYRHLDGSLTLFPFFREHEKMNAYFSFKRLPERLASMVSNIARCNSL